MIDVILYTQFTKSMGVVYAQLNEYIKNKPIRNLYLIGESKLVNLLVEWAKAQGIPCTIQNILWDKFGYEAFKKAVVDLIIDKHIDVVLIPHLDANSLELAHLAKIKNIKIDVLNG